MPTEQDYAIGELADLAGVTPRTIRYYVSIGLLPAPEQAGPKTRYSDGHLKRLRLIRHLQRQHLPLGEIGARVRDLEDEAVEAVLEADVLMPTDSALEYINLLRGEAPLIAAETGPRESSPEPARPAAGMRSAEPRAKGETRTRWERVPLSEHVELHIRQPVGRQRSKHIERLIRLGREMLEEGE